MEAPKPVVEMSAAEREKITTKPKAGIDYFIEEMVKGGHISQSEAGEIHALNQSKEEEMRKRGLPQLEHYGFFESLEEIKERIKPKEGQLFIVRLVDKVTGAVQRKLDINFDQVIEHVEKKMSEDGGFEKYKVEIKEFVETAMAGTIIISSKGRILIECWKGPHYFGVRDMEKCPKYFGIMEDDSPVMPRSWSLESEDIKQQQLDSKTSSRHIVWTAPDGADDLSKIQAEALKAIRYVRTELKNEPNNGVYLEFGVTDKGRLYFIEGTDSEFLTG